MVILDYASADHDHVAVTKEGFWEAIRFQDYFYAFNRSFARLQDAIASCRREMDRGSLISIVVVRPPRFEVWSRVGSEVPVLPKQLLQGGFFSASGTVSLPPQASLLALLGASC